MTDGCSDAARDRRGDPNVVFTPKRARSPTSSEPDLPRQEPPSPPPSSPNSPPPPAPPPAKRAKTEGAKDAPPSEPADGMEVGITSVHPLQPFIPMALKVASLQDGPWSQPPRVSSPQRPVKHLLLLMLDLSPSVTFPPSGGGTPAIHAIVELVKALPAYLAATLSPEQLACTKLAIAAFSGTVGWVAQDHCPHQVYDSETHDGNWVEGTTLDAIDANTVPLDDRAAVEEYASKWVAKAERLFKPPPADRDSGRGTNLEAALRFAHAVADEYCNEHGGYAQVFVATDGEATIGETRAPKLRAGLDAMLFDQVRHHAVPIQWHTLMMGAELGPAFLTALMGSTGLLGYAKDAESIAEGLDAILKPPFAQGQGAFDAVVFVRFEPQEEDDPAAPRAAPRWTMTCYSQGQLGVGDNTTALFGARVPTDCAWLCDGASEDVRRVAAAGMVARVMGFCAPNLIQRLRALTNGASSEEEAMRALLDDGHEVLLDKRLPVSIDRWWAPEYLKAAAGQDYVRAGPVPGAPASPFANRLYPDVLVRDSSSDNLHRWIEIGRSMLQEVTQRLQYADSHDASRLASMRYRAIATSSGHHGLASRLAAVIEASGDAALAEEEDFQERMETAGTPDDEHTQAQFRSLSARVNGSAGHYATSLLSRASTLPPPRN